MPFLNYAHLKLTKGAFSRSMASDSTNVASPDKEWL